MKSPTAIDQQSFKRALSRNIKLPLAAGLAGAAVFVALILYLLSVIGWVEHTDGPDEVTGEYERMSAAGSHVGPRDRRVREAGHLYPAPYLAIQAVAGLAGGWR